MLPVTLISTPSAFASLNDKSVEFTQKKGGKTVGTDKATVDSTGNQLDRRIYLAAGSQQ